MASYKAFMKSGHPPTLLAAFLYFDFSFAIWVLNGAMGPFISQAFHLSPAQIGFMVSVPTLAGAFMRFPLGVLSQYIGRKNAAIVEMSAIVIALLYGFFFVHSVSTTCWPWAFCSGIAGASFGVAFRSAPAGFQSSTRACDGHRRRRQQWHRARGTLCSAAGHALRLAGGLWLRRRHDAAASGRS